MSYFWTELILFPITALTKECNLCCCGIMYAASAKEDVLYWLLNTLSIYPDFILNIMTIITDEDHSFINAFKKWVSSIKKPNVNHVICALHKSRNFSNKLIKYVFSKTQRALLKNLFKIVCYHPNLEYVHKALEKLHNFTPRLTHYIEKYIVPYLKNFSHAYLCNALCHGHNTSSPA
ncbi:hypothetical protein M9Y10_038864 [Tritrichomonas musculus]|uniref:MULE transposase domain-containing protein n=1 Tax=Tritrichomonas musculus TaxID=1915356 RepID=A0ABR2KBF4_9EUKA